MTVRGSKRAPGKSGRTKVVATHPVEAEIDRLHGLGIDALREYWARRFRKSPPPIQSADILHRLIAWRLQVEAFGDLDAGSKQTIARLMRSAGPKGALPRALFNPLKAGSVLVREWRGVVHRVLVLDEGFEHRDKRYRSLTKVARAITGTRWSGPRFFGLDAVGEKVRSTGDRGKS